MPVDRIVPSISYRNFLDQLGEIRTRAEQANIQVATGRRINKASDDPSGISELLRLRDSISALDQFSTNASRARSSLGFTDSVLNGVVNLLNVAIEKGISGGNGTRSAQDRLSIANEIVGIKNQIMSLGNSTLDGAFIFAGQRTTTQPFVLDGSVPGGVRYTGDGGVSQAEISASVMVPLNVPGSQSFTGPTMNVFLALQNLIDGLQANDTARITAAVPDISTARNQIVTARTVNGTALANLERMIPLLDAQKLNLTTRSSEVGDANLAEAISKLTQAQTAESATLSIGSRIGRRSLFDLIG